MNDIERQILKNQQAIMMGLRDIKEISNVSHNNFLMVELGNTNILLNPEQEQTIAERTHDALKEGNE